MSTGPSIISLEGSSAFVEDVFKNKDLITIREVGGNALRSLLVAKSCIALVHSWNEFSPFPQTLAQVGAISSLKVSGGLSWCTKSARRIAGCVVAAGDHAISIHAAAIDR